MYIVFDAGGTFIKYAVMDAEGNIVTKSKIPTPYGEGITADDYVAAVGRVYDELKTEYELEGIAMDMPGQVDVDNGIIYNGGMLTYMDKVNVIELVSKRCDNLPVAVENDGKCAALAEYWKGNAMGTKSACVLVVGTGIGGGIVIDGKVHHGVDMMAGELSFILDNLKYEDVPKIMPLEEVWGREDLDYPRCLLTMDSSMFTLRKRVAKAKGIDHETLSGEQIVEWAKAGDEASIEALNRSFFHIAKCCCNLYMTLAPDVILIGGGISAEPYFIEGVINYVEKLKVIATVYKNIKVDSCRFRNDSNLIGALYNFKQKYNLL